jgi:hypothetical protein
MPPMRPRMRLAPTDRTLHPNHARALPTDPQVLLRRGGRRGGGDLPAHRPAHDPPTDPQVLLKEMGYKEENMIAWTKWLMEHAL